MNSRKLLVGVPIVLGAFCADLFAAPAEPVRLLARPTVSQQASMSKPAPKGRASASVTASKMLIQREGKDAAIAAKKGRLARRFQHLRGIEILELPSNADAQKTCEDLMATGYYLYVEQDSVVKLNLTPNDLKYTDGSLWGMHNTGQDVQSVIGGGVGVADADIDAPEAWDIRTDATSKIICSIDTGVRLTHQDLKDNLWTNPGEIAGNNIDDDGNGYVDDVHGARSLKGVKSGNPTDDNDHGTHTMGTAAGRGNNGVGVAGVVWNARIMAFKAFNSQGSATTSDIIAGYDYALQKGAHVINASFGGSTYSQASYDAILALRDAGVIIAAAAGNDRRDVDLQPQYPAAYGLDNIVTVAASTHKDVPAFFTNYGVGTVDISAPGNVIMSTVSTTDSSYARLSGTSMAAPHVAGSLLSVWAQFPTENYRQIINRVLNSTDYPSNLITTSQLGRLNVFQALTSANNRPPGDDFAKPINLVSSETALRFRVAESTREANEPAHAGVQTGGTIWLKWTAPSDGVYTIAANGSSFDSVIAVYQGTTLNSLSLVAANDNDANDPALISSRAQAPLLGGVTYRIAVVSKTPSTAGFAQVRISKSPANDNFANAETIAKLPADLSGELNYGANKEFGEPTIVVGINHQASVWYKFTATSNGSHTISTNGSSLDTVIGVFTGSSVNALTPVSNGSNDNENTALKSSNVRVSLTSGTTYYIAVAGKGATYEGTFKLYVTRSPANDNLASATKIAYTTSTATYSEFGTLAGTNVGTTAQSGEPAHATNIANRSVWWTWTAPASVTGTMRVDTGISNFDTVLAVYSGPSTSPTMASLTLIGENDDQVNGQFHVRASGVDFQPVPGTTYYFAVDGFEAEVGTIQITILNKSAPPSNDDLANARTISIPWTVGTTVQASATTIGTTFGATVETAAGEEGTSQAGYIDPHSIWFKFTPAVNGSLTINNRVTSAESYFTVRTKLPPPDGVLEDVYYNIIAEGAPDGVSGSVFGTQLTIPVSTGTTYYISLSSDFLLSGENGRRGITQLELTLDRANTAPVATGATIVAPSGAYPDSTYSVTNPTATDNEGDAVTFTYQWQVSINGAAFTDIPGASNVSLPNESLLAGATYRCKVTPHDFNLTGTPFFVDVAVRARPLSSAQHGTPFSYSPQIGLRPLPNFTTPVIINEISQGGANKQTEWVELLFLRDTDLRGWRIVNTSTSTSTGTGLPPGASPSQYPIVFPDRIYWSHVPAGTLLVVRENQSPTGRAAYIDPIIEQTLQPNPDLIAQPALSLSGVAEDVDASDYKMQVAVNATKVIGGFYIYYVQNAFTYADPTTAVSNWPSLSSFAFTFELRDPNNVVVSKIRPGNNVNNQPSPPALGTGGWSRFMGDTVAENLLTANWVTTVPAVGDRNPNQTTADDLPTAEYLATPMQPNGGDNTILINNLRNGNASEPLYYRLAAGSDALPAGLTLNTTSGVISGTPNVPAGGLYHLTVERYGALSGSASQSFDLLVADANGVYTVPAGQTWTLSGNTKLNGPLVNNGTIVQGSYTLEQGMSYAIWASTITWSGADSTPNGDGDGDGLQNLLEYALIGDPLDAASAPAPVVSRNPSGFVQLTFNVDNMATDIVYDVERSSNLTTWTLVQTIIPTGAATEELKTVTDTVGGTPAFLRLKIRKVVN